MKQLQRIAVLFWYGACADLVLTYAENVFIKALHPHTFAEWTLLIKVVIGLILLLAFFVLIHRAFRFTIRFYEDKASKERAIAGIAKTETAKAVQPKELGDSFPQGTTVLVGVWLLALTAFLVIGFFAILNSFCWPDWIKKCLEANPDISNALATMFGAGIGSAIATILGYLEHASERKDFEESYAPWYVGRPLMGMLLGLVFYFLLRDGILAVVTTKAEPQDLSIAGLSGTGALVGLFSKEAIEKLRDVFNTVFVSKKNAEQALLDRLPADLREKVAQFTADSKKTPDSKRTSGSTDTSKGDKEV